MLVTIAKILSEQGIDVGETPYSNRADILNSPFEAGNFFGVADARKYIKNFACSSGCETFKANLQHGKKYEDLSLKLVRIEDEILKLREYGKEKKLFVSSTLTEEGMSLMTRIRDLRGEKSHISRELEDLKVSSAGRVKKMLTYKGTVICDMFSNMRKFLPQIGSIPGRVDRIPLFTRAFGELSVKIIELGAEVAVIGGPCLFGTDEMSVVVRHDDGSVYNFDYNTEKHYNRLNGSANMSMHLMGYGGHIESVRFENRKKRVTLQEYESLRLPFEFANALRAPLVIPIPDMSYKKYLEAVTVKLDRKLRLSVIESFEKELYKISDLYLDVIGELDDLFKPPKLAVVHGRDKESLETFYRRRAPYYERFVSRHGVNALSNQPENIESVTDYIFFPALPFYLWGIGNILQVDSMDEADSLRKCAQAHGTSLSLYGVLYPEMLGKSGRSTIFNSTLENKEYA
ncbi:MAG: hypothetical protein LBS75_10180 [Synergistaceae bacterium]|jgi:hypothetical protein|nr:hypothetical protein [Synergistaceae bacterium]